MIISPHFFDNTRFYGWGYANDDWTIRTKCEIIRHDMGVEKMRLLFGEHEAIQGEKSLLWVFHCANETFGVAITQETDTPMFFIVINDSEHPLTKISAWKEFIGWFWNEIRDEI